VIKFMRGSVENARTLVGELEQAQAWSRLFGRCLELVRELDRCGRSADPRERRIYPVLAKAVHEESRFMAAQYQQLVSLLHRRRMHKLSTGFVAHFLGAVPRGTLPASYEGAVAGLLGPALARRRERLRAIEAAIDRVQTTIDNLCRLGSVAERVRAAQATHERSRRSAMERVVSTAAAPAPVELEQLLARLETEPDPTEAFWRRLQRVLRELLDELDQEEIPAVAAKSVEELCDRYERLLDPLLA
jgi:hypothetical protein